MRLFFFSQYSSLSSNFLLLYILLQGTRYQIGENNNFLFLFQNIPSYRIQMRLFLIILNFSLHNSYGSCFFVYFFTKDQLPVSYFIIFFLLIFIFIYLAEIPLQGPRYQLGENNFLFLFQNIPSYRIQMRLFL